ncbi:MAG TPA: hypothetical protein VM680_00490 [Verrucomicrobiae bacterium]|nr:hypothetical protein [Verrucomicrobiae bacterium]
MAASLMRGVAGRFFARKIAAICISLALATAAHVSAAIQFDVFVGYDGVTREAAWFPVAFEVHNDGPSFNGVIEINSSQFGGEPDRRIPVELPTNTRKRIVVPMFASGARQMGNWDARLFDAGRKVRAERLGVQVRSANWQTVMLGALPRSFAGMPSMAKIKIPQPDLQPTVARFQSEYFPDNPIALEGLDALYINSEKAISLGAPQLEALLAWVRGGGHLIIAVEQIGDVTGTQWLQQFLPVDVSGVVNAKVDQGIISWLKSDVSSEETEEALSGRVGSIRRSGVQRDGTSSFYGGLDTDALFSNAEMPVATGAVRDGRVIMGTEKAPLAVQATRGRGKLTVLLFSPEREPFKSWKHKPYFWARLAQTPVQWFTSQDYSSYGGWAMDGVFGALIDSRQVKKLPVEWLLLLLLVYLVVIGPFDQWWLKKINRQMLTWITFPCYVVFFSLLIYFIGYKLRAGETEWNEVQVVDVYPRGDQADLRGRTYVSVYSSSNARYAVAGEPIFSSIRPEFVDMYGAGNSRDTKMQVEQAGNSFKSQVFVPVWTSLLFVNDWFRTDERPLNASVSQAGSEWAVKVQNPTKRRLTNIKVVVNDLIFEIGALEPGAQFDKKLNPTSGTPLQQFVSQNGGNGIFQSAVDRRRNPLGGGGMQLNDRPKTVATACFYRMIDEQNNSQRQIVGVPGLDMTAEVKRGDAIVLAWDEGNTWTQPINKFQPIRMKRDSMLRLVVPVKKT